MLSYVTGSLDQELLLRNDYLLAENRILRNQIQGRLRLNNSERKSLAEIGARLGRKALAQVATVVTPRNHSGLAPAFGRQEVRREQTAGQGRAACHRSRVGAVDPALGEGESGLGL